MILESASKTIWIPTRVRNCFPMNASHTHCIQLVCLPHTGWIHTENIITRLPKAHLVPAELLLLLVVQVEKKWKRKRTDSCKERERSPGCVGECVRRFVCVCVVMVNRSWDRMEKKRRRGQGREGKSFVSEWELVGKTLHQTRFWGNSKEKV